MDALAIINKYYPEDNELEAYKKMREKYLLYE